MRPCCGQSVHLKNDESERRHLYQIASGSSSLLTRASPPRNACDPLTVQFARSTHQFLQLRAGNTLAPRSVLNKQGLALRTFYGKTQESSPDNGLTSGDMQLTSNMNRGK